jgi:hypothetical protein
MLMARPAYGGRATCESCKSIDVRRWHREGRLRAGRYFSCSWTCDGELSGSINVRAECDAVALIYRAQSSGIGPCPVCGGSDRFAIHTQKQLWNCRNCGVGGNDAISLIRHMDGCGFVSAITTLAGDGVRNQTPPAKREERDVYKDDQNSASRAAWLWSQRKPITEGTPPWLYLRSRRYTGPIRSRYAPWLPFGTAIAMTASPSLSLSGTPLPTSSTIPADSIPGT